MNLVTLLILFLVVFGVIVFVLLFGEGPQLRHGIVGKTHYFLTSTFPRGIIWSMESTLGKKNVKRLGKAWVYCCESRNPFLQIFFMFLTVSSFALFYYFAVPHVPGPYLGRIHQFLIPAHIGVLYYSYYMACTADPGIITANNHQSYMDHYKYDNLLYEPKECTTCKRLKPARSKHCSMCHACVGRSDHHCAWINRCVGVNNHRYFFFFLYSLIQLCVYGTYLCFEVYRGFIVEWGLENATVFDHKAKTQRPITFRQAMVHVMHQDRIIGSLGILATVVAVVVSLFLVYQLYLAGRGMTTNEAFKWEIVEEDIDRGVFYLVEEPVKTNPPKRKDVHTQTPPKERRIKSFSELENIYDLGFVTNIKNVLIPPTFGKP